MWKCNVFTIDIGKYLMFSWDCSCVNWALNTLLHLPSWEWNIRKCAKSYRINNKNGVQWRVSGGLIKWMLILQRPPTPNTTNTASLHQQLCSHIDVFCNQLQWHEPSCGKCEDDEAREMLGEKVRKRKRRQKMGVPDYFFHSRSTTAFISPSIN